MKDKEYYKKYRETNKEKMNKTNKLWARENRSKYIKKPSEIFDGKRSLSYAEIVKKQNAIKIIRDSKGEIISSLTI